jgi:3-oxoacyl-[acyl-carrier-protein] synthase-1/3-oxoacyl-[acyl-carrier-protein] synthase II
MGIISPLGANLSQTKAALKKGTSGIHPLTLFPDAQSAPLPVGEVSDSIETDTVPRAHQLALLAAQEAMTNAENSPEALVVGVTTGGILSTEEFLKKGETDPECYTHHSVGSVTEYLARELGCCGPIITVSTACSSGTVALKIAMELLNTGRVTNVLAGGADSLCRLTYYGFNSLQLIDPEGARPLDANRNGMSVSEGAAMLLLTAGEKPPSSTIARVLGAGLSCDAYHPAAPHPDGAGGTAAMRAALNEARLAEFEIDYINLHGTGTLQNDLSEARAIHSVFGENIPPLSSVKGAFGHSLAASGAIEAVIAALCLQDSFMPANTGCGTPDPQLNLDPVLIPTAANLSRVLSNSFGFGGNNAAIILGKADAESRELSPKKDTAMRVVGRACFTGAGDLVQTLATFGRAETCSGVLPNADISKNLSPNAVRRLKRLPRMALALAIASQNDTASAEMPEAIIFGTGWGPLSETNDFLENMVAGNEELTSPTNFVGSVHNSPAGQIAIHFGITGANITTVGGDYSFEQALLVAGILETNTDGDDTLFVIGADEYHDPLSALFDRSVLPDATLSDGGGALCLRKGDAVEGITINTVVYERVGGLEKTVARLIDRLGGAEAICSRYGMVMAGIPLACRKAGELQLAEFVKSSGFEGPVIDYRRLIGEYASASATAAVLAVEFVQEDEVPEAILDGNPQTGLSGKGVLVIGLGSYITAMAVQP